MTTIIPTHGHYIARSFPLPHAKTWLALGRMLNTPEKWHAFEWDTFGAYRALVDTMAAHLLPGRYYYQREPNLRIHPTGGTCVPWHTDADFGHLEPEWNCWTPLTNITDSTQQIWLATEDGLRYPPFVKLGHVLCFRGAIVEHGNQVNVAPERRSFDFRLIAATKYRDRGQRSVQYGVPLRCPEYWSHNEYRRNGGTGAGPADRREGRTNSHVDVLH